MGGRSKPETQRITSRRVYANNKAHHPEKLMWRKARYRANKMNLPFTILSEDIVIPTNCPILGIPLRSHVGVHSLDSPTLDRIIPSLGYVKGNVQVISYKANVMKNNGTLQELLLMGKWAGVQLGKQQ